MAIKWDINVALHAALGIPVGFAMAGKTNAGGRTHGLLRKGFCCGLFGDLNRVEIKPFLL